MSFKKSSGFKFYGKRKTKWKKSSAASKIVSKVSDSAHYPRTLEAWLLKDDNLLADGISAGCDLYDLSAMLDREPVSVINRLSEVELFPFEVDTEEQIEIYSFALSGVPLLEVLRWCVGSDDRLPWSELDSLRKLPDPKAGIEMAVNNRLWRLTAEDLDDLYWLGNQDAAAVANAVDKLLEEFDAPTPRTVKNLLAGSVVVHVEEGFWASVARRQAVEDAASKVALPAPAPSYNKSSGRGRFGKRTKSTSVPQGAPMRDTRSAADRVWENKTHW